MRTLSFAARLSPRIVSVASVVSLLAATGCASLVGETEAETKFLVVPRSDGTFKGWSEITLSEDANSADYATLLFVTLELMDPIEGQDLTFLQRVSGEAVTPEGRTPVAEKEPFPPGETIVPLDIVYDGDLRPLFPDGHTIRVEWMGQTNPAFTAWPEEGYWMRVVAGVEIE